MGAVATQPRPAFLAVPRAHEPSAQRLFEPGGLTLEDSILGVWEDLTGRGRAECPVCGGPELAADGCAGCGSQLS